MKADSVRTAVILLVATAVVMPKIAVGQATVREEVRVLETYGFGDPNPIPILVRDERLYPYHSFDGYTSESTPAEWKVVVLENDYIEVFVLPEVGGKVWGAVVKETGHEFIYRNEVMKFRNIALRGPWTSGGIEFNFGVIGHAPSTATPVDYTTRQNDDGSASVFVGSMDLPSRTQWRVEVRLPADRAWFETRVLWYNPTPLAQPYYNWMTAAAFAQDDLVMTIPGDRYLRHSGEALDWPVDSLGRDLERWSENDFEGNKSYHVVGELNDFFGGYYTEEDYGFGHWARHEEMPGQKLWIWALSRQGGIWEDLLTDTDGQYVEFQAGRQMVQYQPADHLNPITKAAFDPMSASRWSERWFPLEGTGGLTDASRDGALHVVRNATEASVTLTSFAPVADTLRVLVDGRIVRTELVTLDPLDVHTVSVAAGEDARLQVTVPDLRIDWDSDPSSRSLSRPFTTEARAGREIPAADRDAFEGRELLKARRHAEARRMFERAVAVEPWHPIARAGLGELEIRAARYGAALEQLDRILAIDAHDAQANLMAGVAYAALGRRADAVDAYGWATRSTATRVAAYVGLARVRMVEGDTEEAIRYARLALDHDRINVPAWQTLAVAGRIGDDGQLAREARSALLEIDPIHHFVFAERLVANRSAVAEAELLDMLGGEFPEQTLLEIAIGYAELGRVDDAIMMLSTGAEWADRPVLRAWRAHLGRDVELLSQPGDIAFAAPFRPESLEPLSWAAEHSDRWEWTWLYGLNLWAVGRDEEAADLFASLGRAPTHAPFFVARGRLLQRLEGVDPTLDLRHAVALAPDDRLMHVAYAQVLEEQGAWAEALGALGEARRRFPGDFNLALFEARALMGAGRPSDVLNVLADVQVLPSEHARGTRQLYADAHTIVAMDQLEAGRYSQARASLLQALEWPEHLGEGRPYHPEERLQQFLLGVVEDAAGDTAARDTRLRSVLDRTVRAGAADATSVLDLLGARAAEVLGRSMSNGAGTAIMGEDRTSLLVRRALELSERPGRPE